MKRIYVLQARWVLIGEAEEGPTHTTLTNASVIRRWGTTRGLGEIALKGPTKSTVLDDCSDVEFPNSAVLFSIACTYEKPAP